jgi:hypothetical protein
MKLLFFILNFLLLSGEVNSQNISFPYKGGEAALKRDFNYYVSKNMKTNDSVNFYYVEVNYSKNSKGVEYEISGSGNDSLAKIISTFFTSVSNNWDKNFVKNKSIIIPIIINSVCNLDGRNEINWAQLMQSTMPFTKDVLFVSPIVAMYICGQTCGDVPQKNSFSLKENK